MLRAKAAKAFWKVTVKVIIIWILHRDIYLLLQVPIVSRLDTASDQMHRRPQAAAWADVKLRCACQLRIATKQITT